MPRYNSNRLESLTLRLDPTAAIEHVLRDYPFTPRTYANVAGLASLRQRLQAMEQWAGRITAKVPAKLMAAALLDPHRLAGVFEEIVEACGRAAPKRGGTLPSINADEWHNVDSPEARADRLMYCLGLLGDYVGGNWAYIACNPNAEFGPEGPWELEYNPPAVEVEMLVRGLQRQGQPDRQRMDANDAADLAYRKLRRLMSSAIEDLQEKLTRGIAGVTMSDVSISLASQGGDVLSVHEELVSLVEQMRAATQPDAEPRGSWWSNAGRQLASGVGKWLDEVPARLVVDRHARQRLKRDVKAAFGLALQYAQLMRGNQASYQLVRMIDNLLWICRNLGECIDELTSNADLAGPTDAYNQMIAVTCCRVIVPQEVERYWRQVLGNNAKTAGAVVRQVVGVNGQTSPVQLEALRRAASGAVGVLGEQRGGVSPEAISRALESMQRLGLAMRLPSNAFQRVGDSPRTGLRRRLHDGRSWWFNPLAIILAEDER